MDLQQSPVTDQQQTLFSLENLAVTKSNSVVELKNQLRLSRKMIKDAYTNNATYAEQKSRVDGEKMQLKDIQAEIDKMPSQQALIDKAKTIAKELKEKETEISDYALEIIRISGANQIEKNGETYEIVQNARLVRRMQ